MAIGRLMSRSRAGLALLASCIACNSLFDIQKPEHQLTADGKSACVLPSDCSSGEVCLFQICSPPCKKDVDCSGLRCLHTTNGTACVSETQASCGDAGAQCPGGTVCAAGACYGACSDASPCADGYDCIAGACRGTTPTGAAGAGGAGGAGGISGGAGTSSAGEGGENTAASGTFNGGTETGGSGGVSAGAGGLGGAGRGGNGGNAGSAGASGGAGTAGQGGSSPATCAPACSGSTPVCSQGTCVAPTSCPALPAICGPSAASKCCDPVQVPGGSFYRGYDNVTAKDNSSAATVSAFALDRFEVTVGRFRRFVVAGEGNQGFPPALGAGAVGALNGWTNDFTSNLAPDKAGLVAALECEAGFSTWTDNAAGNEAKPINCVTWYEAQAFCIWDGGRLPTEAEWNFVASAGDQQRVYPWSIPATSQVISPADASYYVDDTKQCFGDGVNGCTGADVLAAGTKSGNSLWGHGDLGGNVAEWVGDYYAPAFPLPCVDCVQPTAATTRVLRGGSFLTSASGLTASSRDQKTPLTREADIGFRCAFGH
jgi:formylglycine-generating enzyme